MRKMPQYNCLKSLKNLSSSVLHRGFFDPRVGLSTTSRTRHDTTTVMPPLYNDSAAVSITAVSPPTIMSMMPSPTVSNHYPLTRTEVCSIRLDVRERSGAVCHCGCG